MIIVSGISLKFTSPPEDAIEIAKKTVGAPVLSAWIAKRAVDARHKRDIRFVYCVALEVSGSEEELAYGKKNVTIRKKTSEASQPALNGKNHGGCPPVVAGFGPAGIFAALRLARLGLRPIVLERGADIDTRVKDVNSFFAGGSFNPSSNVQFGEGGAGAFSDGKLTTRTNDPLCGLILDELVAHGAPDDILIKAKPHIGTDVIRAVVKSIRGEIISLGGEIRFNTRLEGLVVSKGQLKSVKTSGGELNAPALVMAVGHSARDTFAMLHKSGVLLIPKPFSVGVRIEHLQSDTDTALYGGFAGHPLLPPAEYSHSLRENGGAVYTFCMCPGGYVVAAASEEGGVVTNGMSEYARNGENANSALVVSVDASRFANPMDGTSFQRKLEMAAFSQGRGFFAPVQDVGSFLDGKSGFSSGKVTPSYRPGFCGGDLAAIFPREITDMLKKGLLRFDKVQSGFADRQSVLTGVETRTSSPVRVPRGEGFEAEGFEGLYPCGEGAGYAGGIMSAAADGWRVAGLVVGK